MGTPWLHLRLCLTCGHVGCCDSSPMRHARAHAGVIGHPIVRVARARRELAVVLRRRGVRMTQESVGVSKASRSCWPRRHPGRHRTCPAPSPAARTRIRDAERLRVAAADPRGEVLIAEGRPRRRRSSSCSPAGSRSSRRSAHRSSRSCGCTGRAASSASWACSPGSPLLHGDRRRPRRGTRRCPSDRLRECLVGADPAFGDLVLRAYLIRRTLAIGEGHGFRIIGSRFSADTRQAARVRGAQPAAAPVRGPGVRRGRRVAAAGPRHHARRDAGGGLAETRCCATPPRRAGRADRAAPRPTPVAS